MILPKDIQQVYTSIKQKIIEGEYESNLSLKEIFLAERYGVKRVRIRQILQQLEIDCLVDRIPRKGAFVKPITSEYMQALFEMRAALEGMACRLAARRRNDKHVKEITNLFSTFEKSNDCNRLEGKAQIGELLHKFIRKNCKNVLIRNSLELIKPQISRIWRSGFNISGRFEKAFEDHKSILKAINERNESLAEELMRRHIFEAFEDYVNKLIRN
jgi:DNA-binding GntR family transcriptional regulator